jgi:hypothetical protein
MKPKPFWVLKNFTVPTGIIVPFTLLVERRHAHRAGGNNPSFGSSLESLAQSRERGSKLKPKTRLRAAK